MVCRLAWRKDTGSLFQALSARGWKSCESRAVLCRRYLLSQRRCGLTTGPPIRKAWPLKESNAYRTGHTAQAPQTDVSNLSGRERATLLWLTRGYSLIAIGQKLGISVEATARVKASMMRKLGVQHTVEAVRIGIITRVEDSAAAEDWD